MPHSKTKLTPFEAYHGREANTAFRNLTKTPSLKNLNWNNVVNQKLSCLDKASNLPEVELTLDWEERSDLVYAPEQRKTPRILNDDEIIDRDPKATERSDKVPKQLGGLKRHMTSSTIVYQQTGKTDPKYPRRYKRLPLKIEKLTDHTVKMEKGALPRRSGVSFRTAAEESLIKDRNDACTPGPSKYRKSTKGPIEMGKSTPGPSEPEKSTQGPSVPTKFKRKADKEKSTMKQAIKAANARIVEYSADESEENDMSDWTVEEDEAEKTAASKDVIEPSDTAATSKDAIEPSDTVVTRTPKTVEGNRKKGAEGTRKSTRQRRGVDKMGGVMIHRIQDK